MLLTSLYLLKGLYFEYNSKWVCRFIVYGLLIPMIYWWASCIPASPVFFQACLRQHGSGSGLGVHSLCRESLWCFTKYRTPDVLVEAHGLPVAMGGSRMLRVTWESQGALVALELQPGRALEQLLSQRLQLRLSGLGARGINFGKQNHCVCYFLVLSHTNFLICFGSWHWCFCIAWQTKTGWHFKACLGENRE